jgi:hypothetical protein
MNNGSQQQSMLARLLSKENISVQHGKFQTAFFDVKNRVLGLPVWKDKGKDVYDLLVGHEVGHALYTPRDALDGKLPCRKDYLNIVEDVRIEKMIRATYPGLVGSFRRGYDVLNAEDFFGIKGKDVQALTIGDRVNLKAKLASAINVSFSSAEQSVVDQVMAVQTWDDVVAAAIALQKLAQAQAEENPSPEGEARTNKTKASGDQQADPTAQGEPMEGEPGENQADGADDESKDGDADLKEAIEKALDDLMGNPSKPSKDQSAPTQDANGDEQKADAAPKSEFDPNHHGTVPEITTNSHFEKQAKTLVDNSNEVRATTYINLPSKQDLAGMIISNETITKDRDAAWQKHLESYSGTRPTYSQEYAEFIASTKKFVGVLSKEFEMRKAAYQYNRATVSQTGILNVNKLHSYKITDDIFLSVTQLANAKSHGMMMFIDYSYSMNTTIKYVLKHVINLSMFCKATGIPFQVYGFTGDNDSRPYVSPGDQTLGRKDGQLLIDNVVILDLINSSMSKSQYQAALKALFDQTQNSYVQSKYERLGNTPLNETIILAHDLVNKFKAKHKVQKMTTVFLTDGEGQHLRTFSAAEYNENRMAPAYETNVELTINGRRVKSPSGNLTDELIKNLRITTGTKAIGFFIPSSTPNAQRDVVNALQSRPKKTDHHTAYTLWQTKLSKDYKKNKSVAVEDGFGYDQYFVVASGADLDTEDEDLTITSDMTRSKMAKAFSEFSKSKQVNRVFVSKFAETIS